MIKSIDYSQTSFSSKISTKLCRISYGKLTKIDKQSHNSTFSTLPHVDHAHFEHVQKYEVVTYIPPFIRSVTRSQRSSMTVVYEEDALASTLPVMQIVDLMQRHPQKAGEDL